MIIRVGKRKRYTVIENTTIEDPVLTWQATGMLNYLLSKPDNWEVSLEQLEKAKKNGRDSVRQIIKELISAGYVMREKTIYRSEDNSRIVGSSVKYIVRETAFQSPSNTAPCMPSVIPITEVPVITELSQDSNESFVDHGSQDILKTVNSSKAKKDKPNKNSAPEWIAARDRIRLLFMTNYKEWTKAKDGEEAPFPVGPKENTHIAALATRFQNHMPKFEKMLKAFYRVVMTKERGWEQAAFLPSYFVFAEGRIAALVSGLSNSDIMQERNGSSNKAGMKI